MTTLHLVLGATLAASCAEPNGADGQHNRAATSVTAVEDHCSGEDNCIDVEVLTPTWTGSPGTFQDVVPIGDVNADGAADVLITGDSGTGVRFGPLGGANRFPSDIDGMITTASAAGAIAAIYDFGDYDSDGDVDLLTAAASCGARSPGPLTSPRT